MPNNYSTMMMVCNNCHSFDKQKPHTASILPDELKQHFDFKTDKEFAVCHPLNNAQISCPICGYTLKEFFSCHYNTFDDLSVTAELTFPGDLSEQTNMTIAENNVPHIALINNEKVGYILNGWVILITDKSWILK